MTNHQIKNRTNDFFLTIMHSSNHTINKLLLTAFDLSYMAFDDGVFPSRTPS